MDANASFKGSIPQNYDQYLGPLLFEPYAIDLVSRIDQAGPAILELACGTGRVTKHLAAHFSGKAKITATDLNPDMITIARKRVTDQSVHWQPADMQELPFPNESFDAALCQYGIMFVPDKPLAIQETARVLKKGSKFYFNTWDKIEFQGVFKIARRVVTEFFGDNPPIFYSIPFSMHDPHELKQLILENGFSSVEISLVKKEGMSPSALDAARGAIQGNPVHKEILDRDPRAVDSVIENVSKAIAAQYGDKPMRCPLQAWVGVAIK